MGYEAFVHLETLGIWSLSISEAAELVVLEIFYSEQLGELDPAFNFENIDFESESEKDVIKYLSPKIKEFELLLARSVDNNRLKSDYIVRNLDDSIDVNNTYIDFNEFVKWVERHGIETDDSFQTWEEGETEILTHILSEIEYLKKAKKTGLGVLLDILYKDRRDKQKDLFNAWKESQDEIDRLKNEIKALSAGKSISTAKPLSTNARRTHQVIIAALCNKCKIDFTERGASRKIMAELEKIGVPIDDDTIRKILKEIPDSLEARQR